jgi:hypothetical protein
MGRERCGTDGRFVGPERKNKILKVLKRVLQNAFDDRLLLRSPMAGWRPLRTPKPGMRPFTTDEFRRLIGALPTEWRPYFQCAV